VDGVGAQPERPSVTGSEFAEEGFVVLGLPTVGRPAPALGEVGEVGFEWADDVEKVIVCALIESPQDSAVVGLRSRWGKGSQDRGVQALRRGEQGSGVAALRVDLKAG
jgi:hypothetical protein